MTRYVEPLGTLREWEEETGEQEPRDVLFYYGSGKMHIGLPSVWSARQLSPRRFVQTSYYDEPSGVVIVVVAHHAQPPLIESTDESLMHAGWKHSFVAARLARHEPHGLPTREHTSLEEAMLLMSRRSLTAWQAAVRRSIEKMQESLAAATPALRPQQELESAKAAGTADPDFLLGERLAAVLSDTQWDFHTIPGLARSVEASVEVVQRYLDKHPELVRWVPARSRRGNQLLRRASQPIDGRERRLRIRAYAAKALL